MHIYIVTNLINGKHYVGQTTINSPSLRWKCHLSAANGKFDHLDPLITRAIRKHGSDKFTIEYYKLHSGASQNLLNQMECLAIVKYNSMHPFGYNLKEGGSHGKHSKKSRIKMSKSQKGISRNKGIPKSKSAKLAMSIAHRGVPLSKAHRRALSKALKGVPKSKSHTLAMSEARKGKPRSKTTKLAISIALKGRPVSEHSKALKRVPWSAARRAAYNARFKKN